MLENNVIIEAIKTDPWFYSLACLAYIISIGGSTYMRLRELRRVKKEENVEWLISLLNKNSKVKKSTEGWQEVLAQNNVLSTSFGQKLKFRIIGDVLFFTLFLVSLIFAQSFPVPFDSLLSTGLGLILIAIAMSGVQTFLKIRSIGYALQKISKTK